MAEPPVEKRERSSTVKNKEPSKEPAGSVLGDVPHQIRGFLSTFVNMKLVGPAYDRCTGCSDSVEYFLKSWCAPKNLNLIHLNARDKI